MHDLIMTKILPAAFVYQNRLQESVKGLSELKSIIGDEYLSPNIEILKELTATILEIKTLDRQLKEIVETSRTIKELPEKAKFFADNIVDHIEILRERVDQLETIVADDLWPLPKYSEMLFML
jgi:glutamine synthetase